MLQLIGEVAHLIYAIILNCMLLDCKLNHKKDIINLGLCISSIIIVNAYIFLNFGSVYFSRLYPIFVDVPIFILFLFISKYKGEKVLFVLLTVIVLCVPPIIIGKIVSLFFIHSIMVRKLVCMATYIPMLFIVYRYLRPLFLYMLQNAQTGWWAFCAIPSSFYALLYVPILYNYNPKELAKNLYLGIFANILVFSAYVIILRSFKQTREYLIMQNEQNILTIQITALQVRSEALKEAEETALINRHNMRHHLHLINSYLSDNDTLSAKKYIFEIEKSIDDSVTVKYCNNNAVNLILSSYINMAENQNITVESQIYIPKDCEIADMDLCIILSNAIENAINACVAINDVTDRKININCTSKNEKLFIRVTNNFKGKVEFLDGMPITEEENHGFGTKSIATTVEKYNGIYSFTAENGVFKMSIVL